MGRFRSLVNRLLRNPEGLRKHDAVIQDHRSCTWRISFKKLKHCITQHEIVTSKNTTTNIRIVFDDPAKTRKGNQSLNESLQRGLVILEDLCGLLMRFRMNKAALMAVVEKAFLQVGIQPEDRDDQWKPPRAYRLSEAPIKEPRLLKSSCQQPPWKFDAFWSIPYFISYQQRILDSSTVRNVILNFPRSRRHQGRPYRMPQIAPYLILPWRIEESAPFTYLALAIWNTCKWKEMNQRHTKCESAFLPA